MDSSLGLGSFEPAITTAIGDVVTGWSVFENVFTDWVEFVQRDPGVAYSDVPHEFQKKANRVKAILTDIADMPVEDISSISSIFDRAKEISERRNIVVHGHWLPLPLPGAVAVMYRRKSQWFCHEITSDELKNLARDIDAIHRKLMGLFFIGTDHFLENEVTWLTSPGKALIQSFLSRARQSRSTPQGQKPLHRPFPA